MAVLGALVGFPLFDKVLLRRIFINLSSPFTGRKGENMNQKAKKIVKRAVDIFLWVFMAFACFVTVLAFLKNASDDGTPRIGNKMMMTVLTDSMEGPDGFNAGDLIFSECLTKDDVLNLKVNDVITFKADIDGDGWKSEGEYNTHRIVGIEEDPAHPGQLLFTTRGDHNIEIDITKVSSDDVLARWTGKRVAGFGKFISFLQTSTGFLCCIVLPMAALFIYELVVLLKNVNAVRNKDKKVITAEDEELIRQKAIEEFLAKQAQAQAQQNSDAAATENKDDKNA